MAWGGGCERDFIEPYVSILVKEGRGRRGEKGGGV